MDAVAGEFKTCLNDHMKDKTLAKSPLIGIIIKGI
jgi:hypothetical protein